MLHLLYLNDFLKVVYFWWENKIESSMPGLVKWQIFPKKQLGSYLGEHLGSLWYYNQLATDTLLSSQDYANVRRVR